MSVELLPAEESSRVESAHDYYTCPECGLSHCRRECKGANPDGRRRINIVKVCMTKLYEKWSQNIYNTIIMREPRDLMWRVSTKVIPRAGTSRIELIVLMKRSTLAGVKSPEMDPNRSSQRAHMHPYIAQSGPFRTLGKVRNHFLAEHRRASR